MKTSELTGTDLDWAVAKCLGYSGEQASGILFCDASALAYSTNWSQGGPIIEREEIGIKRNSPCSDGRQWEASPSITAKGAGGKWGYGPTPLIAAMRCYVASKLGDEVEIPGELRVGNSTGSCLGRFSS